MQVFRSVRTDTGKKVALRFLTMYMCVSQDMKTIDGRRCCLLYMLHSFDFLTWFLITYREC